MDTAFNRINTRRKIAYISRTINDLFDIEINERIPIVKKSFHTILDYWKKKKIIDKFEIRTYPNTGSMLITMIVDSITLKFKVSKSGSK